jgi:hypothetical protein
VLVSKTHSLPEGSSDRIVVRLTQGNLSYSHIYLGKHRAFFPRDAVGAGNSHDGKGALLTLHFEGVPEPVQTDLDGKKMIFRCRGHVGKFFARHHLGAGDNIIIERLSPYEYGILPAR